RNLGYFLAICRGVIPVIPVGGVIPVGAREDDVGLGGPLGSPASCSSCSNLATTRSPPHPAGDHEGPPRLTSAALAPTGVDKTHFLQYNYLKFEIIDWT